MSRHKTCGWEYFSIECGFASRDSELYLREKYGHISLLVWILLQADLYAVGVCYKWDDVSKYAFMSRHRLTLEQLDNAIEGLFHSGLVDLDVYKATGLLTSVAIQEKGLVMARAARRKSLKCPRNAWLIGDIQDERLSLELTEKRQLYDGKCVAVKGESKQKKTKAKVVELQTNKYGTSKNQARNHPHLFFTESEQAKISEYYKKNGLLVADGLDLLQGYADDNPGKFKKYKSHYRVMLGWVSEKLKSQRKLELDLLRSENYLEKSLRVN